MIKYLVKRLGYGFAVLLGVVVVVFFIFHALPGDPVAMMAGQRTDVSTREAITKELGLDKPLLVQLAYYLNDLSPLSVHEDNEKNKKKYNYAKIFPIGKSVLVLKTPYLRRSFSTNKRVDEIIMDHIGGSFWLAFTSMVFATFFGITFGILLH